MKWTRVQGSGDMVDAGSGGGRSGGRMVAGGAGGLGIGGIIIVLLLQALSGGQFDINQAFPTDVTAQAGSVSYPDDPKQDELAEFTKAVGVEVQDMWTGVFQQEGRSYTRAQIVRFRQAVQTGCGSATSASGPFYCPADRRVYLDMSFYDEMRSQLGASGDFAWAYVIAHELGHHVQNLVGTFAQVQQEERKDGSSGNGAQGLSVRTELQADCFAGVWAHAALQKGQLEEGDIEEALGAAQAVGDDRLQSRGSGQVRPDTFTHGTSAQRQHWFQAGYATGSPGDCDTFSPDTV